MIIGDDETRGELLFLAEEIINVQILDVSLVGFLSGGAQGEFAPLFFPRNTAPTPFPEREGKTIYFRTLTVISVALVVLRAGKDDRKAVYKAISFQTSH